MSPIRIHIDRIQLRIQGIDPVTAQAIARELGPALLRELAHQPEFLRSLPQNQPGPRRDLNLGTLPVNPHQDIASINQTVAQAAIAAIRSPPSPTNN